MTILISAAILVLSAQTALAEQRANKPFNTVNGRTSTAAPAAPRIFTVNTPGGGAAANVGAPQAPSSNGNQTFYGGGRQAVSRGSTGRAVHRGGKAFWSGSRKADGGGTTSTEEAPPNFSKPGALIRTTGQQPKYEKAEEASTHTTDAGEIVMNKRKAFDVGRAPSVQQGPKDTLPPPNPTTGGSGYGSGATANSGPGSSGSGGKNNNGSGNNDKDKPGDDDDGHGGDKARETGFNDAF